MRSQGRLNCLVPDSFGLKHIKPGSLSGMTFVVKDSIAVKGHVSSFGSSRWRETHKKSASNAQVVSRIISKGGDIVGLAKLDQMTFSLDGKVPEGKPPINALYPDRLTGGSSSGTASAISGNLAQVGIGTDTGGSIRVPAAACGLYSIRSTHGAISCSGVLPLAQSFDTVGIMSKDPALIKKTFIVLSNRKSSSARISRVILPEDILSAVDPDVAKEVAKAASFVARKIRAKLVKLDFSRFMNQQVADLYTRLQGREVWHNHAKWVEQNEKYIIPDVLARLRRAEGFSNASAKEVRADAKAMSQYARDMAKYLGKDSAVVLPITYGLPPKRIASDEELTEFRKMALRFSSPSGLSGSPEVVFPWKSGDTGLTYGIGLLGTKGADLSLIEALVAL